MEILVRVSAGTHLSHNRTEVNRGLAYRGYTVADIKLITPALISAALALHYVSQWDKHTRIHNGQMNYEWLRLVLAFNY